MPLSGSSSIRAPLALFLPLFSRLGPLTPQPPSATPPSFTICLRLSVRSSIPGVPPIFGYNFEAHFFTAQILRRKVWDTSSGEIVADWTDSDSAAVYSCIECSNGTNKCKKEKVVLVALGTATGDVLASKKLWTNSSFHSGEVVSLHFSKNGYLIYTTDADGVMYAHHSETGEAKSKFKASKKRINSLSISLGKQSYIEGVYVRPNYKRSVGVASKILQIIILDSNIELVKIPSDHGHAQLISLLDKMAFCSYDTREIHVYNFDPENKTIKINMALHMKNTPIMLECNSNLVLSISDKGIVYVWNIEENVVGSISSTIKIKSERGKKRGSVEVISANITELEDENKYVRVLVAFSTKNGLKSQSVELKNGEISKLSGLIEK